MTKNKLFDEGLKEIENKNLDFFLNCTPLYENEERDYIQNHIGIMPVDGRIRLIFTREGEESLPDTIRTEIAELGKSIFSS